MSLRHIFFVIIAVKFVYGDGSVKKYSDIAYTKLLPCLLDNPRIGHMKHSAFNFPTDAERHYHMLLKQTEKYRNIVPHVWAGYNGSWIENYYIANFMDKPLSYFNGLIPLFIQWVDIIVNEFTTQNDSVPGYNSIFPHLRSILKPNVLYFTVSQADCGLCQKEHPINNILIMSSGGYGHIPIPLIKGELPYISPNITFKWDVGFFGKSDGRRTREVFLAKFKGLFNDLHINFKFGLSEHNWQEDVALSRINLAPRGVGRTSYRAAEVIQIGRIPVYLYSDDAWIPYARSSVDYEHIGFISNENHLQDTSNAMKALLSNSTKLQEKLRMVQEARYYYTYEGVIHQMELFFADPLGPNGGLLRCVRMPLKDVRT